MIVYVNNNCEISQLVYNYYTNSTGRTRPNFNPLLKNIYNYDLLDSSRIKKL